MSPADHRRALTLLWLGLLVAPALIGLSLSLLPPYSFTPVLAATQLQWLAAAGLVVGLSSLILLSRYRAVEARGDPKATRLALILGVSVADAPTMLGVAYFALGGERTVFWALCASAIVLIAQFRPGMR
jgi:hypothetical protein